jgi:HNH endonuclease
MLLRLEGPDIWDPNTWVPDEYEHRIYGDETLERYAIVDAIDYPYLCQFKWSVHSVNYGALGTGRARKKFYLRRGVSEFYDSDGEPYESPITGKIIRNRRRVQRTEFLHQAVMRRMGIEPPTANHVIIDHRDRDTMNCRRSNLYWETHAGNQLNVERII